MKPRTLFSFILPVVFVMSLITGCDNTDYPINFSPSVLENLGYTVGKKPSNLYIFDEYRLRPAPYDSIVYVPSDGSSVELSIKTIANVLLLTKTEIINHLTSTGYHVEEYNLLETTCPDCIGISQKINEDIPYPWLIFQPTEITFNGIHVSHSSWDKLVINLVPDSKNYTDSTWIALGYGDRFVPGTELTGPKSRVIGPGPHWDLEYNCITVVRR